MRSFRKLDRVVNSIESPARTYNPSIDVLLLCTANQCRSPMAEVLLRHHLSPLAGEVTVSSAGLYEGGSPATAHGQDAMARRGLDLDAHRSRQIDAAMVADAGLVIGMAREHVREAVALDPAALAKTFTLKELASQAQAVGERAPDEGFEQWLARLGDGRRREELVGVGHDDASDVADPVGRGPADYEHTADLLDDLLGRFVSLAWPIAVREGAA